MQLFPRLNERTKECEQQLIATSSQSSLGFNATLLSIPQRSRRRNKFFAHCRKKGTSPLLLHSLHRRRKSSRGSIPPSLSPRPRFLSPSSSGEGEVRPAHSPHHSVLSPRRWRGGGALHSTSVCSGPLPGDFPFSPLLLRARAR